jgi:4-hydroxy-tetrahydrodipicolinate reductase
LAKEISDALSWNFEEVVRFARHGRIGERKRQEIGIQTIRGGAIVGEHTLIFCGPGERLELAHKATSRDNFAKGAIKAMKWLVGRSPGMYTMKDVLGI